MYGSKLALGAHFKFRVTIGRALLSAIRGLMNVEYVEYAQVENYMHMFLKTLVPVTVSSSLN